jgi:uncharacterized protein with NAD-binding domain and iron-sulfur cluster
MTASNANRPNFLYPAGSVLMHPPLQLKNSEMYGFFVKGDLAKLQATVDSTLTAVAGGEMRFQVFSPFVMLTFTKVHKAYSTWPSDEVKGWGEEVDIITWVMVGQIDKGSDKISRIFSYPCHIFVDSCMALINGRELFGYPKYQCQYEMPEPGQPARHLSLSAEGFQPFSPDSRLSRHPLIEVDATTHRHGVRKLGGLLELIEEGIELFAANLPAMLEMDKEAWAQIAGMLRSPGCEQIFLKQFPDASGVKAVYQAIVSAPAKVNAVHAVEVYDDDYEVTLHEFASFPLHESLGLQIGAQPGILPFHISFDFEVTPGEVIHDNSVVAPKKIAILGGGVSAMTAAFYLTDQPGWQNQYDITVYQMGWRLGGKGASGRNAQIGQRIEEHGLHIWFGFYQNAFRTIQKAYALLDRPPGAPLATWQDAFKPQHSFCLSELIDDRWRQWLIDTPIMPGVPGHSDEDVTLWDIALTMYEWVKMWLAELDAKHGAVKVTTTATTTVAVAETAGGWLEAIAERIERKVETIASDVHSVFEAAWAFVQGLPGLDGQDAHDHALQAATLKGVRAALQERYRADAEDSNAADDLRHLYICIDLALASLIGMLEDGVFVHGFDVINDIDLRDWFIKHGANEKISVDSAPIRGLYDLVFAYEDGDYDRPNIEAGTMLRGIFRMTCAYQGGIMWKMQAGMGDTVFTPFYEVLKKRGVKFKFFHKVEEIVPEPGTNLAGQIRITRQVDLAKAVPGGDYDPLVPVKGLACWPSTPKYELLDKAQAALLQQGKVNLESNWSNWPELYQQTFGRPLPTVTLQRGVDFDEIVFGIAQDSLQLICPQMVAGSLTMQSACANVKTAATQAYQVWLNKDMHQLGWTYYGRDDESPVLTAFTEPFDTWGPMDQTLPREDWPKPYQPKNVSYFCSVLPVKAYPPFSDHAYPARMAAEVKLGAIDQLQHQIYNLWPAVATPQGFDWSTLVDMNGGVGEKRFDSQYWRANVDPSERYVLSVVNSTKHRLLTDNTGFANFYVTGDWIRTGINAGCVEAAVMAGMQTSRAISGYPKVIVGEKDM